MQKYTAEFPGGKRLSSKISDGDSSKTSSPYPSFKDSEASHLGTGLMVTRVLFSLPDREPESQSKVQSLPLLTS